MTLHYRWHSAAVLVFYINILPLFAFKFECVERNHEFHWSTPLHVHARRLKLFASRAELLSVCIFSFIPVFRWRQQFHVTAEWLGVSSNECKSNLPGLCGNESVPSRENGHPAVFCVLLVGGSEFCSLYIAVCVCVCVSTKCNGLHSVSPPGHKECWLGVVRAQQSHNPGAELAGGLRTESRGTEKLLKGGSNSCIVVHGLWNSFKSSLEKIFKCTHLLATMEIVWLHQFTLC